MNFEQKDEVTDATEQSTFSVALTFHNAFVTFPETFCPDFQVWATREWLPACYMFDEGWQNAQHLPRVSHMGLEWWCHELS